MKSIIFLLLLLGILAIYIASKPSVWGPFVYPLEYKQPIKTYAKERSLDPNLIAAVIYEESHFYAGQESRAGARGLMQVIPSTAEAIARELGDQDYNEDNLLEPDRNIRYGTHYLRYLLDKYEDDLDQALAAYNAGETNVDRWQRDRLQEIPFVETRNFVARVKQTREMYDTIYGKWYEESGDRR